MAERACVKRLQKEYRALCKEPVSHIVARPTPNDILEWHYVWVGSQGTPFAYYYGKIKFPVDYPFKPPGISHLESWNPMWSVSSILTGLLSFMMDRSPTTGSVNTTVAEKQRLAKASMAFNCKEKYCTSVLKSKSDEGLGEVVGAISFQIIPVDTQYVEVPLVAVNSVYQLKGIGYFIYLGMRKRLQSVGVHSIEIKNASSPVSMKFLKPQRNNT